MRFWTAWNPPPAHQPTGNFDVHSKQKESYVGEFQLIMEQLVNMVRQISDTLRSINETSEQVADGAVQLAESSQDIAQGASEQAAAVEELLATVTEVNNAQHHQYNGGCDSGQHGIHHQHTSQSHDCAK